MFKKCCSCVIHLGVVMLVGLMTTTGVGQTAQEVAVESVGGTSLVIEPQVSYQHAVLSLVGPEGVQLQKTFEGGAVIEVDLTAIELTVEEKGNKATAETEAAQLPDGRYKYEVRFQPQGAVFSGLFFVENGSAVSRETKRALFSDIREDLADAQPSAGGGMGIESYTTNDYFWVIDGVNDGITHLTLDSDSPVNNQYFNVVNNLGDLQFQTDANGIPPGTTTVMHVDRSGNVGIGTTAPAEDLHIADSVPAVRLQDTDSGGATFELRAFQPGGAPEFHIRDASTGTTPVVIEEGAGSNRIVIDDTGFVGIGTAAPNAPLHIFGSAGGTIQIERNDGITPNFRFRTSGGGVTQNWLFQNNASSGVWAIRDETAGNSPFRVYPGGLESTMTLRWGRVGIGTTNPTGKLDVNGSIYQRGGVLHADYVFEPDYKMESIQEHSAFMWKEKHLPAVPRAKKAADGQEVVEIGSQRRGILEELEKAHVYIEQLDGRLIEKDEQIADLQTQLKQLKAMVESMVETEGKTNH